ncbi:MAG: ATPase, T2SS/T4P/T4SS family [Bacteriovoracaceae bacterium]
MSLVIAQELFFNRMEKGSLMEADELVHFLKSERETDLTLFETIDLNTWLERLNTLFPLREFIDDTLVNEIIVHGEDGIQIDKQGKLQTFPWHKMDVSLVQMLELMALRENQAWNYQKPFGSFALKIRHHHFRATLLHSSLSPDQKTKLFLRRLKTGELSLDDFDLSIDEKNFLTEQLINKKNILFCGATGSGKTSLMSAMLKEVQDNEHVVLLEDTHEICLNKDHFTYLLAEEDTEKKTLKDYCKYAMRLRPDRIIIGELRGEEAVPFLLSMNNGHKGLMSTIHAHSAIEAPMRLAMLFSLYSKTVNMNLELVLKLVCSNVDYIVHMKDKKINEVVQLLGCEGSTPYVEKIF